MSLPIEPTTSLAQLSEELRAGLKLSKDKLETVPPNPSDSAKRVSIYKDGPVTPLVRVEESVDAQGRLQVQAMDATSLLIRTSDAKYFQERFPKARRLCKNTFLFKFADAGEDFPSYATHFDAVREFKAFADRTHLPLISANWIPFITVPDSIAPGEGDCDGQWNLGITENGFTGNIRLAGAHKETKGDREIMVAVLDTGVHLEHIEFRDARVEPPRLLNGKSIFEPHIAMQDLQSHGTGCAGIILAQKTHKLLGVAPGCSLYPVRIFGAGTIAPVQAAIDGISAAASAGARIVSMSFQVEGNSEDLKNKIKDHPDILFVAAAGNHGHNLRQHPFFPGSSEAKNLISVIGCKDTGEWDETTSYDPDSYNEGGARAHIAAPSVRICVCDREINTENMDYGVMGGSSAAAPQVAGVCALMWSVAKKATVDDIKQWLSASVTHNLSLVDRCLFKGHLNAEEAVKIAKENAPQ